MTPNRQHGRMVRRRVVGVLVALGCAVALGVVVPGPASASCVGPEISVGGAAADTSAGAPVLHPGQQIDVSGEWFRDGCDDTGGGGVAGPADGPGCSGPAAAASPASRLAATERPMQDVVLALEQGRQRWQLAVADARDDASSSIRWTATVPADVGEGTAVLVAGSARLVVWISAL